MSAIPEGSFKREMWVSNPRGTIIANLPPLKIGQEPKQTTSTKSLKKIYRGPLRPWGSFQKEIDTFYNDEKLQKAFDRTEKDICDVSEIERIDRPKSAFGAEKIQVGAEITLSGPFFNNATSKVSAVLESLWQSKKQTVPSKNMPELPKTFDHGDSWIQYSDERPSAAGEPDVIFLFKGFDDERAVRMVGELKSCSTLKMHMSDWGDRRSAKSNSIRQIVGQVADYMRVYRVRYGFVSTYNETVFLKIERDTKTGKHVLFYSDIVKYTDKIPLVARGTRITTTSVRFGILFLLHKTTSRVFDKWRWNTDAVTDENWVVPKVDYERTYPQVDSDGENIPLVGSEDSSKFGTSNPSHDATSRSHSRSRKKTVQVQFATETEAQTSASSLTSALPIRPAVAQRHSDPSEHTQEPSPAKTRTGKKYSREEEQ